MTRIHACILLVMALGGCAAAPASAPAPATPASSEPQVVVHEAPGESQDYRSLLSHHEELDALLLGVPDCARACEHLSALCALAERICGLAPAELDEQLEAQCRDGKTRCQEARERTAAACTCAP